jgi:AcrR family transcriptional regulator
MPLPTWANLDEHRRQRVLTAAMTEFGRQGYSAGSMNVIAREAGVAKGSLFQYFGGKLDLFAHVADHTARTVHTATASCLTSASNDHPVPERLGAFADAWMDYMAEHPVERGVTAASVLEIDRQVRWAVREPMQRRYERDLRGVLTAAVESGDVPADFDVDATISLFVLLLLHLALAQCEPGFDTGLPLCGTNGAQRRERARRLLAVMLPPSLIVS